MKLPMRPWTAPRGSRQWVCNSCSRRAFTSTSPTQAEEPQSPAAGTTAPPRSSPRRQSAAAFAQIRNLQQQNAQNGQRPSQPREPSSPGRYPTRDGPKLGGLRYQPHKVNPQATQMPAAQPQFRIIRSPVDGPPQAGSAPRGGPRAVGAGARQARPANRPGAVRRRRGPRQGLLDLEDEVTETNESISEEALDVTEEELAAALRKDVQKRTGVIAANHGEPNNTYMQRRNAAVTARLEKYRSAEEKFQKLAHWRLRKDVLTFGGKNSLKKTSGTHTAQAHALPYMLALQRNRLLKLEKLKDSNRAKWASLTHDWVSGKSAPYRALQPTAKSKESKVDRLRTSIQNYIGASPTYASQDRKLLLDKIEKVAVSARL